MTEKAICSNCLGSFDIKEFRVIEVHSELKENYIGEKDYLHVFRCVKCIDEYIKEVYDPQPVSLEYFGNLRFHPETTRQYIRRKPYNYDS